MYQVQDHGDCITPASLPSLPPSCRAASSHSSMTSNAGAADDLDSEKLLPWDGSGHAAFKSPAHGHTEHHFSPPESVRPTAVDEVAEQLLGHSHPPFCPASYLPLRSSFIPSGTCEQSMANESAHEDSAPAVPPAKDDLASGADAACKIGIASQTEAMQACGLDLPVAAQYGQLLATGNEGKASSRAHSCSLPEGLTMPAGWPPQSTLQRLGSAPVCCSALLPHIAAQLNLSAET